WDIECMPSDSNLFSAAYRARAGGASFTVCDESNALPVTPMINGPFYDEIFWDTGIKKPTARHTYGSIAYCPDYNELVMFCRRFWRYSLTQKAWVYKRIYNDNVAFFMDGEHGITIYDEVRHEALSSAAGSSGIYNSVAYRMDTQAWSSWGSPWGIF